MCNSSLKSHLVCLQTEVTPELSPTTHGAVSHCFQISGGSQANEDLGEEPQSSGVQPKKKTVPPPESPSPFPSISRLILVGLPNSRLV